MKHLIIALCIIAVFQACKNESIQFNPPDSSHIVFVGNTFADRMQYHGYFEAALQENFPAKHLVIRNLGWSADEPELQPRPLNFGTANEHLQQQKADIIFACYGMNEAFKGPDSLESFRASLDRYCKDLLSHRFNDSTAPQLILVSPIAHENIGGHYPSPDQHNSNLELYTKVIGEVAAANKAGFIDLFHPFLEKMKEGGSNHLTINGIHLTDQGYSAAAAMMCEALGIKFRNDGMATLKKLAEIKNQHFFYRWRAVNGEYIYGRRQKPFGIISYPPEMKKLDQMVSALDSITWRAAGDVANGDQYLQQAMKVIDESGKKSSEEQVTAAQYPATTAQFTIPKGYEINLFASEKNFPIEKPVAMNFDARGRLWVATMPAYPQYLPGYPARDRIVILEDTDNDGKADKHTVFADSLYLPLGFVFGNGGVYVAEEPNLLFLADTDGDDKMDRKEIVLQGFGSEDSHHATHAFTWGQDGAIYFHEGTFHHSQVETPYGPMRASYGATFRYEPRTGKVSNYISYPYNNPWGNVFDKWGMHLIGDASDGMNYYATPLTTNIDYPGKHPHMEMFTATKVRPTAGIELISSRHFPDDVQGNFLVNNTIGFQGIKQHRVTYSGSGLEAQEIENLLQSSDPNFRPVDLKFAPDGSLYVVDWFNPLIGHMQHSIRDPGRDKSHGRIWRITYPAKPLLKTEDLSKQSIPQLLDNLKQYEDRLRYRTRELLRTKSEKDVLPQLNQWVNSLDKNDSLYEHNLLEALWQYQDFDSVNIPLLTQLLAAKDHRARAAATRVLFYWRDRVPDAEKLMIRQSADESQRVRIEAVAALSYFKSDSAALAVSRQLSMPMDYYLHYAVRESLKYLKPLLKPDDKGVVWLDSLQKADDKAAAAAEAAAKPKADNVFEISTLPAKMLFDKAELVLPANRQIIIRFKNPDEMPHNFVIIKNGSVEKVGKAADAMAAMKDGFERSFVPTLSEVLFATPLVEPGKSFDMEFYSPAPGEREFICSFPGHWNMMKGKIRFVAK